MEDEEDEEHKQYAIIFMCFALLTHTRAYTFSHAHELTKTNGSRDANVDAHDINDATTTTTQRP